MPPRRLSGPVLSSIALTAVFAATAGGIGRARAAEVGGQFGFGAGLAAGRTHGQVYKDATGTSRTGESGGGGLGLDLAARFWAGPVVLGADGAAFTSLFGPSEVLATAGGGLKLELGGRWRSTLLIQAGGHKVYGLGNDLFANAHGPDPSLLPCWGIRLAFEKQPLRRPAAAHGLSLFVVSDIGREELDVDVTGLGGGSRQRHQVGGVLGGAMYRLMFGS